jgi:hypothetical protein
MGGNIISYVCVCVVVVGGMKVGFCEDMLVHACENKNQIYLCRKFTTCRLLRYCNGLFIHYKTSEGVLHGEFKQTYVITIQSVLDIIKELAGSQAFVLSAYSRNKQHFRSQQIWEIKAQCEDR